MSAKTEVGTWDSVCECLAAFVANVRRGRWWLAGQELDTIAWSLRMRIRNEVARLAAWPAETEECYLCSERMDVALMTPYATNDGDEHLLCTECWRFHAMLAASFQEGAS